MTFDFVLIISQVATLFILIGIGYVLHRMQIFNKPFIKSLSGFLLNVTMPALIISSFQLRDLTPELLRISGVLLLLSLLIYGVAILLACCLPKLLGVKANKKGLFQFMLVFSNVGFIGYP